MKKYKYIHIILALTLLGLNSCLPKASGGGGIESFDFSGKLLNTTGVAVRNATIKLIAGGVSKYQITSDSLGKFNIKDVETGVYTINITATGYNPFISIDSLKSKIDTTYTIRGSASVSGTIVNSQTGNGLTGATVSFTVDQPNSTSGSAALVVTTDNSGSYTITDGPTGDFTGNVVATNYFPRHLESVTFSSGDNTIPPSTLVSQPDLGQLRIILNWGSTPYDLDSHFTGPTAGGSRFHIYYSRKTSDGANLDVDDTNSYGPETVTISAFVNGTYRYSVYNYSNKTSIGGSQIQSSPAKVEIYDHSGLIKMYNAPVFTGVGNTWQVFELIYSGTNANILTKNVYITASGDSDVTKFSKASDTSNTNLVTKGKTNVDYNLADF